MQEKIITFLKSHPALKLSELERACGITPQGLSKAIKNLRPIPAKYIPGLVKELGKYGFKE